MTGSAEQVDGQTDVVVFSVAGGRARRSPGPATFDVNLNGPLGGLVRPVARVVYRSQMERAVDLLVQQAEARAA